METITLYNKKPRGDKCVEIFFNKFNNKGVQLKLEELRKKTKEANGHNISENMIKIINKWDYEGFSFEDILEGMLHDYNINVFYLASIATDPKLIKFLYNLFSTIKGSTKTRLQQAIRICSGRNLYSYKYERKINLEEIKHMPLNYELV